MTEFILISVIVLAVATLYTSRYNKSKLMFDRMSDSFLFFAAFHSIYALIGFIFFENYSFNDIAISFFLAYGPFFYWGINSLINLDVKKGLLYAHFFPAIFFSLLYITVIEFFSSYISEFKILLCFSVALSMLVYAVYAFIKGRKVYDIHRQVKQMIISASVLLAILALSFALIIIVQVSEDNTNLKTAEAVLYIGMLAFIFIVFRYKIEMFRYHLKKQLKEAASGIEDTTLVNKDSKNQERAEDKSGGKYAKSAISGNILQDYEDKLKRLFEEDKIYLESDITLEDVAKRMKLSKHHLTQLFNIHLGENFNQYINRYRINYSCLLLKSNNEDLTIEEIAFESGFNSKVSFNRHFKNFIGCTPSDYLKSQ